MKITVVLAILAVMAFLRFRKVGLLTWVLAWWVGFYVAIRFGFKVPIPSSVIAIYMGIATVAMLAYVSSGRQRREDFSRPLIRLATEPRYRLLLAGIVVALPALAAAQVYFKMTVPLEPPLYSRTIHPASPATITVHEKEFDINHGENPYRGLEKTDPAEFTKHVENGRRVYYRNCVFCHGDDLAGNGMFIHGLNPIPTNFADKGTIPQLEETFLFWRVSKGGPGLPEEGGPWDSAMPAWEKFLTTDEMWDVILFMYDFTEFKPRAKESVEMKK